MTGGLEAEIGRLMARFNTPGVAVRLLADDRRHSAHVGLLVAGCPTQLTSKARFSTLCVIKVLIAIDLLMLAEKGDISLDDRIADYLPELGKGPKAKGKALKIRHLLSHTAGVRSCTLRHLLPLARESWQNCVDLLHDADQMFEPGTVFEEDHLSHIILGQLLSRLRDKPILELVQENVLGPIGICPSNRIDDANLPDIYTARHSWNRIDKRWEPEPDNYPRPDSTFGSFSPLSMTSADLLKLGETLLFDAAAGRPTVSQWTKDQLFSEAVHVPREISPWRTSRWQVAAFGMGMATFRDGHCGLMTTGRGQNSSIIFDRARQSVLALAMNTPNGMERDILLDTVLAKFAGDASIVPESRAIDIDFDEFIRPFTTRDIGGVYLGYTPDPIEIFATPRSFTLRIENQDRYRFEANAENRLVMHAKMPLSIGIFQDPTSLRPCLSMGMHPFKKVA
jgi:CubicO group peptidase (beta-lactamase class C family)